ncbi:MAG: sulfotransferase family protein [Acidimicrobiales bacterium]
MLPTFLIIGAQKAATTSLWEYLRQHPGVYVPPALKEVNYFIEQGNWDKGIDWYERLYSDAEPSQRRGDVSPGYSMFPFYRGAPARAAELIPDARVVYMIRHPVERMVSAWVEGIGWGIEDHDLVDAALYRANYLLLSCYWLQLEEWLACFPREQVLVLRSEDLAADPGGTLDKILVHIGLEPAWRPSDLDVRHNLRGQKSIMPTRVRGMAGALRRLGWERSAVALGPRGRLKRLAKPVDERSTLSPELYDALGSCFRADLAKLRQLVGDEMDLWGLA